MRPSRWNTDWTVLGLSFMVLLGSTGLLRFGYPVILPDMRQGLGLAYGETGLLSTGSFMGYIVSSSMLGYLASRIGIRVVLTISMLLSGVGMLVSALASGFQLALVGQTVAGFGNGGAAIAGLSLALVWFGPQRRGLVSGVSAAGAGLGLVVSGLFLPGLQSAIGPEGWRFSWLAFASVALAVGLACLAGVPRRVTKDAALPSGPADAGVTWWELYRSGWLMLLGFIYMVYGFACLGVTTFFVAYAVKEVGMSAQEAGAVWGLVGILSIGSGLVWGAISDRIGRSSALAVVFSLLFVSIALIAGIRSPWGFYTAAVIFGLVAWGVPTVGSAACGDLAPPKMVTAALGAITLPYAIGQAASPAIAGYLADTSGSFSSSFYLAAVVAILGAVGALLLARPYAARLALKFVTGRQEK